MTRASSTPARSRAGALLAVCAPTLAEAAARAAEEQQAAAMSKEAYVRVVPGVDPDCPALIAPDAIKTIAESCGIADLKDDVAAALAPDVEFRLRDIVQEAIKFMKMGKRDKLSTADINHALQLRHCEPLYGFVSSQPPRFCRAGPGVFYLEDPELNLGDMLAEPLPPPPREPSLTMHWLAVDGVQPNIPQNPSPEEIAEMEAERLAEVAEFEAARQEGRKPQKRSRDEKATPVVRAPPGTFAAGATSAAASGSGDTVPLERHHLTAEEQKWLETVSSAVTGYVAGPEGMVEHHVEKTLEAVLRSVANDPSTRPLSPFLSAIVRAEVTENTSRPNIHRLTALVRLMKAMVTSHSINLESYLHQLLPAVLTCIVGKRLCAGRLEDHWSLRHMAAAILAKILNRFKDKYQPPFDM